MQRRLLAILAILSLLPLAVLAGVWLYSYRDGVQVWSTYRRERVSAASENKQGQGGVSITCSHGEFYCMSTVGPTRTGEIYMLRQLQSRWGFTRAVSISTDDPSHVMTGIHVPCWAVLPVTLIPAAWGAIILRRPWVRRRRKREGLCLACGYDLRASGERCPECGMATASHGNV